MKEITILCHALNYPEAHNLTKEDVWGEWDDTHEKIHDGMVIARTDQICPIWGDKVPYKSVTIICNKDQAEEASYWLEYVHGADCIGRVKPLKDNKIAIRSDYMCW